MYDLHTTTVLSLAEFLKKPEMLSGKDHIEQEESREDMDLSDGLHFVEFVKL